MLNDCESLAEALAFVRVLLDQALLKRIHRKSTSATIASHSTASNSTASAAFRGDGSYVRDGGALLETLWCYCEWKEIRNCPGRYTVRRRRDLARWPPERLLGAALGAAAPQRAFGAAALVIRATRS